MARPLRIEFAHAVYYVMSRGDAPKKIVRDDRDRAAEEGGIRLVYDCMTPSCPCVADAPVQLMSRRNFRLTRSGNIHVVQNQYWFLHSAEKAEKLGVGGVTTPSCPLSWRVQHPQGTVVGIDMAGGFQYCR